MVVTDIKSGVSKKVHYSTEWLNHLQASPADPQRVLFCHEGAWHQVDRIWTIRTDGKDLKLMHERTVKYEIADVKVPDRSAITRLAVSPGATNVIAISSGKITRSVVPVQAHVWKSPFTTETAAFSAGQDSKLTFAR